MNDARAVCRERGYETALHQVDDHGREARLDHVSAKPPDDSAVPPARIVEAVDDSREVCGRQDVRQRTDQAGHPAA